MPSPLAIAWVWLGVLLPDCGTAWSPRPARLCLTWMCHCLLLLLLCLFSCSAWPLVTWVLTCSLENCSALHHPGCWVFSEHLTLSFFCGLLHFLVLTSSCSFPFGLLQVLTATFQLLCAVLAVLLVQILSLSHSVSQILATHLYPLSVFVGHLTSHHLSLSLLAFFPILLIFSCFLSLSFCFLLFSSAPSIPSLYSWISFFPCDSVLPPLLSPSLKEQNPMMIELDGYQKLNLEGKKTSSCSLNHLPSLLFNLYLHISQKKLSLGQLPKPKLYSITSRS